MRGERIALRPGVYLIPKHFAEAEFVGYRDSFSEWRHVVSPDSLAQRWNPSSEEAEGWPLRQFAEATLEGGRVRRPGWRRPSELEPGARYFLLMSRMGWRIQREDELPCVGAGRESEEKRRSVGTRFIGLQGLRIDQERGWTL